MSENPEIDAEKMNPAAAEPVPPAAQEMDPMTHKIIVSMADTCRKNLEFSTLCNPGDTPMKIASIFSNLLEVDPAAFNVEIKGKKAFIKVSPECIALVAAKFFYKSEIVDNQNLGEFLEAKINFDDGKFYKFRISNSSGGISSNNFYNQERAAPNAGRGRSASRGRGRGGRGRGRF